MMASAFITGMNYRHALSAIVIQTDAMNTNHTARLLPNSYPPVAMYALLLKDIPSSVDANTAGSNVGAGAAANAPFTDRRASGSMT